MNGQDLARAGWAGVLLGTALLAGCGGGGGDSPSAPAATPSPAPAPGPAPAPPPVSAPPPAPPPATGVAIPSDLAVSGPAMTDIASATAFSSNASSIAGLSFAWTFGDGATSTLASPTHDYAKVGAYEVGLTVTNADGASKTVSFAVSVNNRAHVKGLSCSGVDSTRWCWQAPLPTGSMQNDTRFLDGLNGWSVGDNGELLRTVDAGKTWQSRASGVTTRLTGVRFGDALNGWVTGDAGVVLRSTDGGLSWARSPVAPTVSTGLVPQALGANTFLLASGQGTWATGDGGANWVTGSMNGAKLADDGTVWASSMSELRKSVDLGQTSVAVLTVSGPTQLTGYQTFGQTVIAMTTTASIDPMLGSVQTAAIRRSTDGGQSWETIAPQGLPSQQNLSPTMSFRDPLNGAVSTGNTLYRTQDGGRTWATMGTTPGVTQFGLLAQGAWTRPNTSTATGTDMSEDDGLTWTAVAVGAAYQRLTRVDARTWTRLEYDGSTFLSSDGLQTWSLAMRMTTAPSTENVTAMWFFDAKRGLTQRSGGRVMATADGGRTWTLKSNAIGTGNGGTNPLRMQFADETVGWTLSPDGRLFRTDNGGGRWTATISFASNGQQARAFHFVDASTGFAFVIEGGSRRLVLATVDGGLTWMRQADLGTSAPMVRSMRFSSALKGVMVGEAGALAVTSDGGQTWTSRTPMTGATLNEAVYSDPGTLWVVGDGGLLRVSRDDGLTWQSPDTVGVTTALRAIRFLDAQRGWAVGDDGVVLATTDGGLTWALQASGTRQALTQVFFADPRTGWVAGNNGTLLATGTGGR